MTRSWDYVQPGIPPGLSSDAINDKTGNRYALMDAIDVGSDWTHAFYLGVELARAETAWRRGKRYLQDNPLRFGVADGEGPAPC